MSPFTLPGLILQPMELAEAKAGKPVLGTRAGQAQEISTYQ